MTEHSAHKRVSRRGVLTAGGAAVLGGAAAMVVTGNVKSNDGDLRTVQATEDRNATPSQLVIPVDQLAGSDDERILAINERTKQAAGKGVPVFEFNNRVYTISTPIRLYSGLKRLGPPSARPRIRKWDDHSVGRTPGNIDVRVPVRRADRAEVPNGRFSPDISMSGLLFEGGSRTDVFPRLAMTGDYVGRTLWYCNLHNLGVRDMRTFWWGYGTGVSLTGTFHAQSMSDTPLFIGGSDNTIFGTEAQSFMDNSSVAWEVSAASRLSGL